MDLRRYCEARERVVKLAADNKWCAIHAVLVDIFDQACLLKPKVIVDIGVRPTEGFSSKVFCEVADLFDAQVHAYDIVDCSKTINHPRWHFEVRDGADVSSSPSKVDVLCIDTTERFKDVVNVLNHWHDRLSADHLIILRCTNLKKTLYYQDGSKTGLGWDNERGVISVVEELYTTESYLLDETLPFQVRGDANNVLITHLPWGAGVTFIRRFSS